MLQLIHLRLHLLQRLLLHHVLAQDTKCLLLAGQLVRIRLIGIKLVLSTVVLSLRVEPPVILLNF